MMEVWLMLLGSVVLGSAGVIFTNLAAPSWQHLNLSTIWTRAGLDAILNIYLWSGILISGTSLVLWLKVIGRMPLGTAYAVSALSYPLIALFSWFALRQRTSPLGILGMAVIVGGVILVGFGQRA